MHKQLFYLFFINFKENFINEQVPQTWKYHAIPALTVFLELSISKEKFMTLYVVYDSVFQYIPRPLFV